MGKRKKQKFYAVQSGRCTGVFQTWDDCREQVTGYVGARFKSFATRQEAEDFAAGGKEPSCSPNSYVPSSRSSSCTSRPSYTSRSRARSRSRSPKRFSQRSAPATASSSSSSSSSSPSSSPSSSHSSQGVSSSRHTLYTDGACRGNPGVGGAGAVLYSPGGGVVDEVSEFIGDRCTNNEAEYIALIHGLEVALKAGVKEVDVHMDSQLIVKQMNGEYRVKAPKLKPMNDQARSLSSQFGKIKYVHVPRELNSHADELANNGIDSRRT